MACRERVGSDVPRGTKAEACTGEGRSVAHRAAVDVVPLQLAPSDGWAAAHVAGGEWRAVVDDGDISSGRNRRRGNSRHAGRDFASGYPAATSRGTLALTSGQDGVRRRTPAAASASVVQARRSDRIDHMVGLAQPCPAHTAVRRNALPPATRGDGTTRSSPRRATRSLQRRLRATAGRLVLQADSHGTGWPSRRRPIGSHARSPA